MSYRLSQRQWQFMFLQALAFEIGFALGKPSLHPLDSVPGLACMLLTWYAILVAYNYQRGFWL